MGVGTNAGDGMPPRGEGQSAKAVVSARTRGWPATTLGITLIVYALPVLSLAVYVRFAVATTTGMSFHGDCWQYLNAAGKWAQGDFEWLQGDKYYRPAIHLLHAATVKVGGWNDVSIKLLNAVFDTLTIALVGATLWQLRRNVLICLAGSLLYAVPTFTIQIQVLQELPHGPSTSIVVCAVLLIVVGAQARHWARYVCLAGGGLLGGIAANMHPDMALVGPGLVLFLLAYHTLTLGMGVAWKRWLLDAAVVTLAFLTPHAVGLAYFGADEVITVISNELTLPDRAGYRSDDSGNFVGMRALRMPFTFFEQLAGGSWYWALGFYLASALAVYRGVRYRKEAAGLAAPTVVLVYCALFAVLIGVLQPRMARVMLPLFPLMVITYLCSFDATLRPRIGRISGYVLLGASLCTSWLPSSFIDHDFAPTRLRVWYEELVQEVGPEERLLVLPSTTWRGWAAGWHGFLGHPIYLGRNVTYLTQAEFLPMPYRTETLDWTASLYSIGYALVTAGPYDIDDTLSHYPHFNKLQGGQVYSVQAELDVIHRWLGATQAELVVERGGDRLYKLPPVAPAADSVMRESSFVVWEFPTMSGETVPWQIPGAEFDGAQVCFEPNPETYLDFTGALPGADAIQGIWIECSVEDKSETSSGTPTLEDGDLIALWARADDYTPGEFPYNLARHSRFHRQGGEQSQFYYAGVSSHKTWRGQIDRLAIRIKPSGSAAGGPYRYCVRRIGLTGP